MHAGTTFMFMFKLEKKNRVHLPGGLVKSSTLSGIVNF